MAQQSGKKKDCKTAISRVFTEPKTTMFSCRNFSGGNRIRSRAEMVA